MKCTDEMARAAVIEWWGEGYFKLLEIRNEPPRPLDTAIRDMKRAIDAALAVADKPSDDDDLQAAGTLLYYAEREKERAK